MFTIKKAIIKIDTDEYKENLSKYDGYIDCSDSLREPNEVCDVCSFDSADKAEKEIDRTIQLSIDDENARQTRQRKKLIEQFSYLLTMKT